MQVLRRKIAQAGTQRLGAVAGGGAERAFRLALARAARDAMGLALDVTQSAQDRLALAELVDLPPDRALMLMLDQNGGDGLGLIVLSPPLLSGLVEMLTTGRVTAAPPPNRRPTRTDGAMLAALVDAALAGLDTALADDADRIWAAGWRYAGFVEETRTLGLLLEDAPYQVIRAEVALMDGAKSGPLILALPERAAASGNTAEPAPATDHSFSAHLAAQVDTVTARLDAVVGRLTLPLARLATLLPGETLPLPLAGIDRVRLVGLDGRLVGEGRLGQARGLRAIRLTMEARADGDKGADGTRPPAAVPLHPVAPPRAATG
ncbi:MAG: flagellar switch protein FliM [Rhodobacteraceae bacterium PARR1]|nr:MAG: flagellar switch protein FliM [Rhodobacteraceae bacterium PARR1]